MKNKEYHDDGFQQQSPQRLVDKYKHTSSPNDLWRMRLKLIQEEYYFTGKNSTYAQAHIKLFANSPKGAEKEKYRFFISDSKKQKST